MRRRGAAPRPPGFGFVARLPMRRTLFGRKRRYDRSRLLGDAARMQRKGKLRKAAALYREVLAAEPGNVDLERKLAPLLARTGRPGEAWDSYRRSAQGLAQHGFVDRAVGVYREAARYLPRQGELWQALAELELKRGRRVDAVEALLAGARALRSRREGAQAIRLLERAHQLDPSAFEVGLALAGRLAQAGRRERALRLLEELAACKQGRALRRIRGRQLRIAPGPRAAWHWLRALAA
jgi:tetratricopeptide (TPR) repeat protein